MIGKHSSGSSAARRNWAGGIVVTIGCLLLLYLVVRNAIASLTPAGAALPPADPSVLARATAYAVADPRQSVSAEMRATGRQTALAAPLAYEPFFIAAKAEEQSGRLNEAIRLMEEARRRRPSFVLTRLQLLAYYQQSRRFPELLNEINFVLGKEPEAHQIILPELAKLMTDERGRVALASILAREPDWREEFFRVARSVDGDANDALSLLNLIRARKPGGDLSFERTLYFHRLVEDGEYGPARNAWLQILPPQHRAGSALLFNGSFGNVTADPPFGWTFRDEAAGRASIDSDGRNMSFLDIVYFGGSNVLLADQTLALEPGRYQLSQLAKSEQGIQAGAIQWTLTCLNDGLELARLRLRDLTPEYRRSQLPFTVPPGCAGQILRLTAEPGDIAAQVDAQIARLELNRAD